MIDSEVKEDFLEERNEVFLQTKNNAPFIFFVVHSLSYIIYQLEQCFCEERLNAEMIKPV